MIYWALILHNLTRDAKARAAKQIDLKYVDGEVFKRGKD